VACSFESAKDVKDAVISDDGRKLRIGMALDPKQESALVDFLKVNLDVFAWKPSDMKGIQGRLPSTNSTSSRDRSR
jgi:hypothetical protein